MERRPWPARTGDDADLTKPAGRGVAVGNPTEASLLIAAAAKLGIRRAVLEAARPRIRGYGSPPTESGCRWFGCWPIRHTPSRRACLCVRPET